MPEFIKNPPMTNDDLLDYSIEKMKGGRDLVISKFEGMSNLNLGLYLDL